MLLIGLVWIYYLTIAASFKLVLLSEEHINFQHSFAWSYRCLFHRRLYANNIDRCTSVLQTVLPFEMTRLITNLCSCVVKAIPIETTLFVWQWRAWQLTNKLNFSTKLRKKTMGGSDPLSSYCFSLHQEHVLLGHLIFLLDTCTNYKVDWSWHDIYADSVFFFLWSYVFLVGAKDVSINF